MLNNYICSFFDEDFSLDDWSFISASRCSSLVRVSLEKKHNSINTST